MLIMKVGIVFHSSKWSWKIIDYEYGTQIPYLAPKFFHLWSEKFSYGKSYLKRNCLLYDGTINKTRLVTSQKNSPLQNFESNSVRFGSSSLQLVYSLAIWNAFVARQTGDPCFFCKILNYEFFLVWLQGSSLCLPAFFCFFLQPHNNLFYPAFRLNESHFLQLNIVLLLLIYIFL